MTSQNNVSINRANILEKNKTYLDAIKVHLQIIDQNKKNIIGEISKNSIYRLYEKLSLEEQEAINLELLKSGLIDKSKIDFLGICGNGFSEEANPLVSIVVPCYNCEKYLQATLDCLVTQTYKNIEIILVDDFSTDGTSKICKSASVGNKRIKFYQHRANGGLACARNSGTRLAKGKYICYLDSDDLLAKESIEQRIKELLKYGKYSMIAGVYDQSITVPDDYSGDIAANEVKGSRLYVDFISALGDCPFNANQPLLRKSVVISMGGFPENYPQAEDWRLWSKILRAGYVFIPVYKVGSGYRQSTNSMIRRAPLLHVEKSLGNYFRAFGKQSDEHDVAEIKYETLFYSREIFSNSAGVYLGKQKFIPRIFNFLGIEYARLESIGEGMSCDFVIQYIKKVEPDFLCVFVGYSIENAVNWFANGYKRFFGIQKIEKEKHLNLSDFVKEVLAHFSVVEDGLNLGTGKISVPDRVPKFATSNYVDVLFVPHKKYHTKSFMLLLDGLNRIGVTYKFLNISVPYRDEEAVIKEVEGDFLTYNEFVFSRILPRTIVCMNDWDTVVKPIVQKANLQNIPTIGMVEGVQDYLDVDTGRKRNPYRTVSNVFLTGEFDRRYFDGSDQKLYPIGVQRLEGLCDYKNQRLSNESSGLVESIVVLNVNFSYGVMTDKRMSWVSDVKKACDLAGLKLIISQHPQDDGDLSAYDVSTEPLYDLLARAKFFISRFSGAILESLVVGCPVVYYNGHEEKIDKFSDSCNAYYVAHNVGELVSALKCDAKKADQDIDRFLKLHACYGSGSIVDATVNAIKNIVDSSAAVKNNFIDFKKSLLA